MLHTDMDPLPDDAAINLKTPEQVKYYHGNSVQLDALTHDKKIRTSRASSLVSSQKEW